MERPVERRPQQFGHAGVEHDEMLVARLSLHVHDPGDQRAGGSDDRAAGFDHQRKARRPDAIENGRCLVVEGRRRRHCRRCPQPATEIEVPIGTPPPAPRAQSRSRGGGASDRVEGQSSVIRRAGEAQRRGCSRTASRHGELRAASSSGTPNLFLRRPVEMCGWLRASMSDLTRSATRASVPSARAISSMRDARRPIRR